MCYSNQAVAEQVIKDARKFFDGKGLEHGALAAGDYFAVVAMDSGWCKCKACQAQIDQAGEKERREGGLFSIGTASDYWFTFVNKVAREVAKTHPDKYLATLAYADYAHYPKVKVEPNVSVGLCLHVRHQWSPGVTADDLHFYRDWVGNEKGRPLYLYLYYCFPELGCRDDSWHCFPGFSAHTLEWRDSRCTHATAGAGRFLTASASSSIIT